MAALSTAIPKKTTAQQNFVKDFIELRRKVAAAGFMRRRYVYYWSAFIGIAAIYVGLGFAFFALGDSWWQLLVAAGLAITLTQTAFLGHDAAHMQIFKSAKRNEWASLILANLLVGLSYGWWQNKHSRHHANPNIKGKDPDIEMDVIVFTPEQAEKSNAFLRWWYRRQGYMFFPLVCLEGINLHVQSLRGLLRKDGSNHRWIELVFLTIRIGGVVFAAFWFLSPLIALAFLAVQLGVFGFYMGCSFAPNHKGMEIFPQDMKLDFMSRQVLTSRNISGSHFKDLLFGGLNYQIEHHLFPAMPRIALREVAPIVKAFCAERGVKYTETTMLQSFKIVVAYLNRVGLGERDPFDCPLANSLRMTPSN
ncbi:MAG TPA: acyl-CoA desaturase [Actinomycetales bacterium]|nr:acyl-CoA desaturase [Actinomycetales bacterium]